ncbi:MULTISPECIES: hypothetical protein [unclassified Caballeronia]|uniref:hypothetical protein n=1 Tax=unclassified Caballeronia TaxID=2646786 RepID=UPI0013EA6BE2|nr:MULTISPECIES: hypothetical protein [unclassified Caballeronia]
MLIFASLAGDAGNEPEGEADDMASPVRPSCRAQEWERASGHFVLNAQRATGLGRQALEAVYGGDNEPRSTARGMSRSRTVRRRLKRWMGDGDGFAGMAGVGYRKL